MAYKFVLAQTKTLDNIGNLTGAKDKTLTVGLDKSGNAAFNIPNTSEIAPAISPIDTCIKAILDGEEIWAGPVWTAEDDLAANRLNVTAVGWFELFAKRFTKTDLFFDHIDAGQIAVALVAAANADLDTGIKLGSIAGSQPRTYLPLPKNTSVGQHIIAMSEIESGYDFEVTPEKYLNIYQKRGSTRPEAIFGFHWGPKNLQNLTINTDGSAITNRMIVSSPNNSDAMANDYESQNRFGLFEDHFSISSSPSPDVPPAFANAEIAARSYPKVSYNLFPKPHQTNGPFVPRPFIDYNLGDIIYLSAKYGRVNIGSQPVRIFGFTINIENNGIERVSNILTTYS